MSKTFFEVDVRATLVLPEDIEETFEVQAGTENEARDKAVQLLKAKYLGMWEDERISPDLRPRIVVLDVDISAVWEEEDEKKDNWISLDEDDGYPD